MAASEKKYVINVDFPEPSLIHLNPRLFHVDSRCRTGPNVSAGGGMVYASAEEAQHYLDSEGSLLFNGKKVTNLRICMLCSKIPEFQLIA